MPLVVLGLLCITDRTVAKVVLLLEAFDLSQGGHRRIQRHVLLVARVLREITQRAVIEAEQIDVSADLFVLQLVPERREINWVAILFNIGLLHLDGLAHAKASHFLVFEYARRHYRIQQQLIAERVLLVLRDEACLHFDVTLVLLDE